MPVFLALFNILLDYLYSTTKQENKVKRKDRKMRNKIIGINKSTFLDRQYTIKKLAVVPYASSNQLENIGFPWWHSS